MPKSPVDRPPAFRIPITYTDTDLKTYQRVILDRQRRDAAPHGWAYWLPLIATGSVVALCGGVLGVIAGLVSQKEGGFLAVLVFAGFYIGAATQPFMWNRFWEKARRVQRDLFRAEYKTGAEILVTDTGIFMRKPNARGFYAFSAIKNATLEDGLVILWLRTGSPAIAIPIRLVSRSQRERLLSLGGDGAWAR